jgi:uncharacterized protein
MSAYVVELAALRQGSTRLEAEASPRDLGLDGVEWRATIRGVLECDRSGDQISIRASLSTLVGLECSRCLADFPAPLAGAFTVFSDRGGKGRPPVEDELERGDYMKFHDGRQLDLREEARESLLLEWPMAPLCRPDCRGLCPHCGADLNQGPCGCGAS